MFSDVIVPDNDVDGCFHPLLYICLTNNMVARINKLRVHFPSICDIEVALPGGDKFPQTLKCFCTMVTQNPTKNSLTKVIYCCPQPDFIFFDPTKVSNSSSSPTNGLLRSPELLRSPDSCHYCSIALNTVALILQSLELFLVPFVSGCQVAPGIFNRF